MAIPTSDFFGILAEATSRARGKHFDEIVAWDKDGNETTMKENDFLDLLTDTFLDRGLMDKEVSMSDNPLITTRSMAFSLNAINNINMAGKVKWHIDDIVNHLGSDLVREYGKTEDGRILRDKEARNNIRRSLKEYVDKQYEVEAKSPAAKSLVSNLQRVYDRDYADTNATREPDRFLKDGLVFIHMINDATDINKKTNGGDLALKKLNDNEFFSVWSIGRTLLDGLNSEEARYEIARDMELPSEKKFDVNIKFGDLSGIKLSDFFSNAKSHSLSQEQLDWASQTVEEVCENIFGSKSPDAFGKFLVNGEPMFTPDDLDGNTPAELSSMVIQNMLAGKLVSVKDGLVVNLSPKLIQEDKEKSFFEKVYEAIADFFNFDSAKEKKREQSNIQKYQKDIDKTESFVDTRKKLTFAELLCANDVKRTVPPPSSSHEKSKGRER